MNIKMVLNTVGKILIALGGLMLLPVAVSLIYGEKCVYAFIAAIGISLVLGYALTVLVKPRNTNMYAKEGFAIVTVSWIILSLIGALPFFLSGEVPNYIDAVFETVSGFTTTGASILKDVEALSRGLIFWRSFTHWIGGMGVLVFVMAISPTATDRSLHIMRAEMPGPIVGKLVPKAKETAKILYIIYIVLTLVEVVFLLCGGLSLFDSAVLSFGTAGTGGFSMKASGIAKYSSYVQWVITAFMLIFGVNFNLYFLILIKRFKMAITSSELWVYLCIVLASITLIAANISKEVGYSVSDSIRYSAFQVSSIVTTTGYATADFNLWPTFSKAILVLLMFIGGCAGSTAGGFKVSRVIMLFKSVKKEFGKLLHPRSVNKVNFEGKTLEDNTISGVTNYLAIYMICILLLFVGLSLNGLDFETNATAAITCFNNVGPGLSLVGPFGGFSCFNSFSKVLLSFAMLLGRLEIFPVLLFFTPATWVRTK